MPPNQTKPGQTSLIRQSRKRSSPAADRTALWVAGVLLVVTVWFQRAALHPGRHLYLAVAIPVAFAIVGRLMRGVNTSGAIAGAIVAFILATRDLRMFWVLMLVFFVTLAATRAGTSRKNQLKMAEAAGGRSAAQVMSNLGIAALTMVVPTFKPALVLALAALAEVAADTTSSEIGAAFSTRTILITTRKTVSPGTDGGISLKGTMAGIVAAAITAACAAGLGLASGLATIAIAGAGIAGMLVDSVLGATLEQRGYLDNNGVNLLGTATAALAMWALLFGYQGKL